MTMVLPLAGEEQATSSPLNEKKSPMTELLSFIIIALFG
jgi:hypothetical protein